MYKKQKHDIYIEKFFKKETISSYALVSNIVTYEVKKNLFFLFSQFGQGLTGHKYYNKFRQSKKLFSEAYIVSDEVYSRLTIESCGD